MLNISANTHKLLHVDWIILWLGLNIMSLAYGSLYRDRDNHIKLRVVRDQMRDMRNKRLILKLI